MNTQYFYLVTGSYDETIPLKVFLQEKDAIQWGRKRATQALKEKVDPIYKLYKQPITRTGMLEFVKTLQPYPEKPLWEQYVDNHLDE